MKTEMEKKIFLTGVFSRIFFSSILIGAAVVAVFAVATYTIIGNIYQKNIENVLSDSAEIVGNSVNENVPLKQIAKICNTYADNSGIRTTIINSSGEVLFDSGADASSMLNHLNRSEIKSAFTGKTSVSKRYSETLKKKMIYIARPAKKNATGSYEICVRQSMPLAILGSAKKLFTIEIILLSIAAIILSGLFSYFFARRISTPLKHLKDVAGKLAEGDFDTHIPHSDVAEIQSLAESLQKMSAELKRRVNSLHKRNCELDEIFEHMNECVFICTKSGRLLKFNKSCANAFNIFGAPAEFEVASAFRNYKMLEFIENTFEKNSSLSCELELEAEKTFSIVGSMLPYESSEPRALFVLHDISVERKNEALRREFVAGVSHELKTPITAVKMAAETLCEVDDKATAKRFVSIIAKESDRMNLLVDDMLLLSKIEFSKKFELENFEEFSVRALIDEAVSINENNAKNAADEITISCPADLMLKGDFTLLQISLSNLIGNAIKYGGESCKIEINALRNASGGVEINVKDNGMGIAPEHQNRVFERFYRANKGRSRALGGTGLGLAIVKHVAILHNGFVSVKSTLGKGSEFTITLNTHSNV